MDKDDIKSLRERLGWTQSRMARFLGVDRSSVSRIETGQPVPGPIERLLKLLSDAVERGSHEELAQMEPEAAE